MWVLLEKNLGVLCFSDFEILLHSLLQLALSSSLAHLRDTFYGAKRRIWYRFPTPGCPPDRIRESVRCPSRQNMFALFLLTVFMVDGDSILQFLSFLYHGDSCSTSPRSIPGVLNLQGFDLSKSRSCATLCERRERKGGWFTSVSHLSRGPLVYLGATRDENPN